MPFPEPPYPCSPLAVVTTSAGRIVAVEDSRIIDANRARLYKSADDPPNVVRVTPGWFVHPEDGYIRRYDPTTDPGWSQPGLAQLELYPGLGRFDGGELRIVIPSAEASGFVPAPGERTRDLYFYWAFRTQQTVVDGRYSFLSRLALAWGWGWPDDTGTDPLTGLPNSLEDPGTPFSRLSVVRFHAVLSDDLRAGEVLSVTDVWTPF
jgi:hypothetical protein